MDLGVAGRVPYGREVVTVSVWCKCRMRINACQLNVRVHALLTEHRQFRRLTLLQQSILHLYVFVHLASDNASATHHLFVAEEKHLLHIRADFFFVACGMAMWGILRVLQLVFEQHAAHQQRLIEAIHMTHQLQVRSTATARCIPDATHGQRKTRTESEGI